MITVLNPELLCLSFCCIHLPKPHPWPNPLSLSLYLHPCSWVQLAETAKVASLTIFMIKTLRRRLVLSATWQPHCFSGLRFVSADDLACFLTKKTETSGELPLTPTASSHVLLSALIFSTLPRSCSFLKLVPLFKVCAAIMSALFLHH